MEIDAQALSSGDPLKAALAGGDLPPTGGDEEIVGPALRRLASDKSAKVEPVECLLVGSRRLAPVAAPVVLLELQPDTGAVEEGALLDRRNRAQYLDRSEDRRVVT